MLQELVSQNRTEDSKQHNQVILTERMLTIFDWAFKVSISRSNCCFQSESRASSYQEQYKYEMTQTKTALILHYKWIVGAIPEAAVLSLCLGKAEKVASLLLGFLCSYHAVYQSYPEHEAIVTLFWSYREDKPPTTMLKQLHLKNQSNHSSRFPLTCKFHKYMQFYVRVGSYHFLHVCAHAHMREREREIMHQTNHK